MFARIKQGHPLRFFDATGHAPRGADFERDY